MSTVTADIAVSLDGFAAGPNQSEELPFGEGLEGERLHTWMFEHGDQNPAEVDAILGAGAYIMGRNMFGPGRGEWDLGWTGWWQPEPPYRAPVFVLTHHRREPVEMPGGTTFIFVTDEPESALTQARRTAGDGRVAFAGGAATLNQYLSLGAVDELRLHVVPITLGAGERVFDGVTGLTFDIDHVRPTEHVVHVMLRPAGRHSLRWGHAARRDAHYCLAFSGGYGRRDECVWGILTPERAGAQAQRGRRHVRPTNDSASSTGTRHGGDGAVPHHQP